MIASPESWSRPADRTFAALAAIVAVALFFVGWALVHEGFYGRDQIVDTPVYQRYGDRMADGQVPYRDFRLEYPPLALPLFLVPSLVAGEGARLDDYSRVFEWELALCGAALLVLMAGTLVSLGAEPLRLCAAVGFAALAPLLLGSVVLSRFDLWPALLTSAALAALVAGRDRLGAGVLGLGVAAKLYPVVLLPLALAWVWRRRGRQAALASGAVFLVVVAACLLPFLLVGPDGVGGSLERQLSRPLQIESLGSAVLLALGVGVHVVTSHGSQNIAGGPGGWGGALTTLAQLTALVWIWLRFARGPADPERLVRYSAAAVLAFVAFGKVLSPQFMIWLVPLVPLVRGRRGVLATGLLALALVLTQVWFPSRYWDLALRLDGTVSGLVLARDLVLLAALAALLWPARTCQGSDP
jgi:Glycosyltransferase family 87